MLLNLFSNPSIILDPSDTSSIQKHGIDVITSSTGKNTSISLVTNDDTNGSIKGLVINTINHMLVMMMMMMMMMMMVMMMAMLMMIVVIVDSSDTNDIDNNNNNKKNNNNNDDDDDDDDDDKYL